MLNIVANDSEMKRMIILLLMVCLSGTLLTGCKKNDGNADALLLQGRWDLKQYGPDTDQDGVIDDTELTAVSGFSKYFIFYEDYSYLNVTVSGFSKDTISGSWSLPQAATLQTVAGTDTANFTIKDISNTSLTLLSQTGGLGTPYWQIFSKK